MITVKLQGGLGNQLFEYAAGRALAARSNTGLQLDIEWYKISPNRTYDLAAYAISGTVATQEDLRKTKRGPFGLKRAYLVKERSYSFDPHVLEAGPDAYLVGYLQSEKYFADIADTIRREFTLKTKAEGLNAELLKEIEAGTSVSLHVRRGDYVTTRNGVANHGAASLEYYQRAVDLIATKVASPHFYVFSDDPAWTQENLKFDYPTTFVTHNGKAAQEDLRLMSACKHFIIANSTFSWWGAWLGANPEKKIVAPERWFVDPKTDTSDLIPASWIRL